MKGLELSRAYYEAYGKDMLKEKFPEVFEKIATGVAGSGSECLGYDDAVSADHDFDPGFCIFLPGEEAIDRRTAFLLERAYHDLPSEFEGYKRPMLSPVGGNRRGVIRLSDFLTEHTGSADGILTLETWLTIPEQYLLEVTGGEVFSDPSGIFTSAREYLSAMPEDVVKKRLAGQLLLMGQAGQYNYDRCLRHGERAAAQLAMNEFVQAAVHTAYLLNRTYMPYYKWCFRGLRTLVWNGEAAGIDGGLSDRLEMLITTPNDEAYRAVKSETVEEIARETGEMLKECGFADLPLKDGRTDLERAAYAVNDSIADGEIRNLHILCTV